MYKKTSISLQPVCAAEASESTAVQSEDLQALAEAAQKAAELGAEVVRSALDKPMNITFKGVTDLVTDTDKAGEAAILEYLQQHFPDHGFLGEEGGVSGNAESEYLWAIDPLDGTTNFTHQYPSFGVSVAVLLRGQPKAAAVVEFAGGPHAWVTRTYTASEGQGAYCNGHKISVTDNDNITRALLVTGFGYEHDEAWTANMDIFKHFTDVTQGVRRLGAAAVDLCHVALGVVDGFWEYRLKPWDVAAGILIVKEAGGEVTTMDGEPYSVFSRSTLATNGALHDEIVEVTGARTDALKKKDCDLSPWFIPPGYEFDEV